jgi:hypothetical protein
MPEEKYELETFKKSFLDFFIGKPYMMLGFLTGR